MEYEYNLEKELKEISFRICENYNTNLKEKDKSMKVLFEVKEQFIELLRTYVKEEWVNEATKENIELVDKEFTTIELGERRADVVYKIKLKKQEIYFFLLEFQSTIDKMMPFRLYEYMLELYRKYKNNGKLPMIIPCVLYIGNSKWNVGDMKSLFKVRKELERYIPNFDYILIDVNNYTDEELIQSSNLISSVFFLSKSKNENDIKNRLVELAKTIKKLKESQQKAFIKWVKMMFIKKPEIQYYLNENLEYEKEEENMGDLSVLIPKAIESWKEEGRKAGIKTGINEGLEMGIEKAIQICKSLKISKEETIKKITESFEIEIEKAKKLVERYW